MATDITEFRKKLLRSVCRADSARNAIRIIDFALNALNKHNVHGHLVVRFIDKILVDIREMDHCSEKRAASNVIAARDRIVNCRNCLLNIPVTENEQG